MKSPCDVEQVVTGAVAKYVSNAVKAGNKVTEGQILAMFGGFSVDFFKQDDFTVALLQTGGTRFVGVSKRNKTDKPMPIRGRSLALSRAVNAAVMQFVLELNPKPEAV